MAKKSKHEKNDFIMDIDDLSFSANEDLLAEKNKKVLSLFGDNITVNSANFGSSRPVENVGSPSPLELLKSRMGVREAPSSNENEGNSAKADSKTEDIPNEQNTNEEKPAKEEKTEPEISLLEKLKRYTIDDKGHDVTEDTAPLYKLESVAEILKSDSDKLIDKLSQKYDVTVDNLSKKTSDDYLLSGIDGNSDNSIEEKTKSEPETKDDGDLKPVPTPAFEKMANESKQRFEKSIFDDLFPQEAENSEQDESTPDISDIDNSHISGEPINEENISDTATIRFTPIKNEKGNTQRINISSSTIQVDINQELTSVKDLQEPDETLLEMSDFDLFAPKCEVTDIALAKSQARKLAYKKRRNFLSVCICSLCSFILVLFLLPFLSDIIISATKSSITVCSGLLFISILANVDMFADIINLFKHRASHDCIVSLCAISTVPLCISAIINGENIYHLILLSALIMLARSVVNFMQTSTLLSNLNVIKYSGNKFAVSFIKDTSTSLAMAKNSIEGDVLIATPRKTEFISDFMKFSLFKKKFSGKMPIVFIITLIISAIGAVMGYFYYKTAFAAIYSAAAGTMMAAMPAVMFVDALPLFTAAKKLSKRGAMIAGTFGADNIELANAAVVDVADIFPAGSITLKNFKVLSNNDIDKTIVNAAALTEEIGSPLAPIFNKIAGTNTSYQKPDSDTIKYEEKLGLSGWVDDELLFIGNRTLMEAHGIEVPNIEVDKKILRSGYFPVYVATGGKASALIIVEYEIRSDIQKLLRQISRLGITLLIKNCDPNVNEEMICDYFGLYEDSIKVMTNVGVHMYENATSATSTLSAPAGFRGSKLNLLRIMNCASRIRISNNILSVFYALASILGVWYFAFTSFAQSGGMLSGGAILLFEILASAFAILSFLFRKP